MKKILILLALMVPISVMANDTVELSGFTGPTWEDFAPSNYIDVDEPRGLGKLNETATYWYNRRIDFEKGIEECKKIEDNDIKLGCYQELKVKQYQLNSDYNARLEAQEQARMVPQEMFDRTDNMLPIGGYLNNFSIFQPNELR